MNAIPKISNLSDQRRSGDEVSDRWRSVPSMTLGEAQQIDKILGEFLKYEADIIALPDQAWMPKFLRRTGIEFQWSIAYEIPLAALLAMMMLVTKQDRFLEALKNREGYSALIAAADAIGASADSHNIKRRLIVLVIACLVALVYNVRAIGLHSQSIDKLLVRALHGDVLAMRRVVAIDPTVLAMPSVNAHIARMRRLGKHRELKQLYRSAANGPNKELQKNARLRYFERVLHEGGVIELEGREAVFRLVTERLRLHTSGGSDPFKNLYTTFQRWRESATT